MNIRQQFVGSAFIIDSDEKLGSRNLDNLNFFVAIVNLKWIVCATTSGIIVHVACV